MDEQITPVTEPVATTPDPVTLPAGEANTTTPNTELENASVEALQAESPQSEAEPVSALETPQTEPVPELIPTPPETQTAQLAGNEPLPGSTSPPVPSDEATAEMPQVETPTLSEVPATVANPSEETPPKTEESPPTPPVTQQGTAQPEPLPESPMPAQGPQGPLPFPKTDDRQENLVAPVVASSQTSRSIVRLLFEKAKLTIQLRKQKKFLKIIDLVTKNGKITNDDVQKLLRVSDATATRYLSEMEKQGKISQTGKTGRSVTYTKR